MLFNYSLIDTNKVWYNTITCLWGESYPLIIYFGEDTSLNSNNYTKVYCYDSREGSGFEVVGFAREEEEKIYYQSKDLMEEGLIYDFSASKGDILSIENYFTGCVIAQFG